MAKKDPHRMVRRVAQYEEEMDIPLSKEDIDKNRNRVLDLLDALDEIEDRKKEANDAFKAEASKAEMEIERHRLLIRSKVRKQKVTIEEWLTASNQVQVINSLTGEYVNSRNATAEELQEPMFPESSPTAEESMQFGEEPPP